jgi:hypothetical protein
VAPFVIEGVAGVTAIDVRVAAETERTVEAVIEPEAAWIVDEPTATPVASPALDIVATEVFEDVHVAVLVMFCVLASENVAVAVNC